MSGSANPNEVVCLLSSYVGVVEWTISMRGLGWSPIEDILPLPIKRREGDINI